MSRGRTIVWAIFSNLSSREGFDEFWYRIDDDIQVEILDDLVRIVEEELDEST